MCVIAKTHREHAVKHVEHVVQTVMAMKRRPGEAWVDGRLRKKERPRSVVAAGLDDDRGAAASGVPLAFALAMYHRLAHRSRDDTQTAQRALKPVLASRGLDRAHWCALRPGSPAVSSCP
jgi:hypothetical protein